MFGMGMGELLLIMVVALLVVGPDKLPQAAKAIGKGIRDFRRHTQDLQTTLEQDENLGEAVRELRSALRDDPFRAPPAPRPSATPAVGQGSSAAEPPSIVPAAGAVAKDPPAERTAASGPASDEQAATPSTPPVDSRPVDARPDPRPGTTPRSRADDPAHG
jgi:sec-independent protein translocase protein TatB